MSQSGASPVQERVLTHTGSELGDNMVTRSQNQNSPQLATPVIAWECPRMYEWIEYVGRSHSTKGEFRTEQTVSGTANDDTVVTVDANLQPVAGETDLADQEDAAFPVAIAADDGGNEVDITSVDYAANTVTLAQDPADGTDFHVYPLITTGTVQYRGVNQFDQVEGTLSEWSTPIYKFADYDQNKRGTEVNLDGRVRWDTFEQVELLVDSPHQVVWQHPQFPRDEYVSKLEQRVNIRL
jgi:hypothetical protein